MLFRFSVLLWLFRTTATVFFRFHTLSRGSIPFIEFLLSPVEFFCSGIPFCFFCSFRDFAELSSLPFCFFFNPLIICIPGMGVAFVSFGSPEFWCYLSFHMFVCVWVLGIKYEGMICMVLSSLRKNLHMLLVGDYVRDTNNLRAC